MGYVNLCHDPSPMSPWFRKSPTLAMELGLTTTCTHNGGIEEDNLTPAGQLMFGVDGLWYRLSGFTLMDRETLAWMMLEEGWSRKSWIMLENRNTWCLYHPVPLPPSTCKILQHYFALAGIVTHRTPSGFLSNFRHHQRELVVSDPVPVIHSIGEPGEVRMPSLRPPFAPFVRWHLEAYLSHAK